MAASTCVDTFVLRIIADADCDLVLYPPGSRPDNYNELHQLIGVSDPKADEREFAINPGNEDFVEYLFAYVLGSGYHHTHGNFGFSATDLDDKLSGTRGQSGTGNKSVMSIGNPILNPPTPDVTGGPRTVKYGSLRYNIACRAIVDNGEDQNLSGSITLNTGI